MIRHIDATIAFYGERKHVMPFCEKIVDLYENGYLSEHVSEISYDVNNKLTDHNEKIYYFTIQIEDSNYQPIIRFWQKMANSSKSEIKMAWTAVDRAYWRLEKHDPDNIIGFKDDMWEVRFCNWETMTKKELERLIREEIGSKYISLLDSNYEDIEKQFELAGKEIEIFKYEECMEETYFTD